MTPAVVITPAAERDIADALARYAPLDPALALAFRLALDTTLSLIAGYPESYVVIARGVRRALLRRFPYGVFYRHQPKLIHVVGVFHTSLHPRIWHARSH